MQLYVIRHAQSVNNALWAETGAEIGRSPDPELTEVGHQQAQHLAHHLGQPTASPQLNGSDPHNRSGFAITHLYASLMVRSLETGHYVAEALDLPLHIWPEIHEWGGIFEQDTATGERKGLPGISRTELGARFKRVVVPDWLGDEGWWNRPYEPRDAVVVRAQQFVQGLLDRHGDTNDRVAIITHGGFAYALLGTLLHFTKKNEELDVPRHVWFMKNNTSISRVDFGPDYLNLLYMNRVDHLPTELIT